MWVGAVLTGLLWRGALALFSNYVRDLSRFSMLHGSIATVIVFLLWIYVSAVILLYGVEVTATHVRLRRHRADLRFPRGAHSSVMIVIECSAHCGWVFGWRPSLRGN